MAAQFRTAPLELPAEPPAYHYAPGLGDPSAPYRAVLWTETSTRRPAIAARLERAVIAEIALRGTFRREPVRWVAPRGTPCAILGIWADGTIRLRIRLHAADDPQRVFPLDGRFPAWVAQPEDGLPPGEILPANYVPGLPMRRRNSTAWLAGSAAAAALVVAGASIGPRELASGFVRTVDTAGELVDVGVQSIPFWLPVVMARVRFRGPRLPLSGVQPSPPSPPSQGRGGQSKQPLQ